MKTVWMKVTNDIFEFPIVVADTQAELERILHLKPNSIASAISKARKRNTKCCYIKVLIDED